MRVFNADKTEELFEYDLNLGRLAEDRLFIARHEAVEEVQEQFHYEVEREYPNGGKDLARVIDVPYVAPAEAWDEYEDIQVYVPYTEEELKAMEEARRNTPEARIAELEEALELILSGTTSE